MITRYLLRHLLIATVFITVTLTAVIWLTQSLKLIELIADSDAPPSLFLKIVALTLPRFLEIIMPISLVAAILFTYNKFIMDNELIVLRACGFDQMKLAMPALIVATGMTLLLLSMTTYLSPRSYAEMHVLKQSIKAQYSSFLLREGVFNSFSDKMTVYLRARDTNGDLLGLVIHDMRDKDKPPVTVTAKRGRIVMNGDIPSIVVVDGMRQQRDGETDTLSKLYFSRYTIEIKGIDADQKQRWHEASERTLPQLLTPDLTNKQDRKNRKLFMAEAHHRVVTPFNALGFTLVSVCGLLLGPFNRRGLSTKVIISALTVTALQALNLVTVSLAKKNLDIVPLLYVLTFLPIFAGFFLLSFRGEVWLMAVLRRMRIRHLKKEYGVIVSP